MSDGPLSGRVVVVTGASRGIGAAVAQRFAHEGALVAAVARTVTPSDRLPGSLADTIKTIVEHGGQAASIQADLARPGDRERAIAEVVDKLGPVDILINNAAASWLAPAETFDLKKYDLMFSIQVRAPFELARLVIPGMRQRGAGWILNVSSEAAPRPDGPPFAENDLLGTTVYGMCKAALERMTFGLAAELHGFGIAVNALAPGRIVRTWGTVHHGLVHEDRPDEIEYPEEFAQAALQLCTGDPREVTNIRATTDEILERFGLDVLDLNGKPFVRPATGPD